MTFEQLFKRLQEIYTLWKYTIPELHYREMEIGINLDQNFGFLHGFINGLHTVGLINDNEFNELFDTLTKMRGDEG